jgi:hypothetical protein
MVLLWLMVIEKQLLCALIPIGSSLNISFMLLLSLDDLELLDVLQREVVISTLFEMIIVLDFCRQLLLLLFLVFILIIRKGSYSSSCLLDIVSGC